MSKNLDDLAGEANQYDTQSRELIKSLKFAGAEIEELKAMKRTEGWKVLDRKVREELQNRILRLVENDPQVIVLLSFLKVADTKSLTRILNNEIAAILPDD